MSGVRISGWGAWAPGVGGDPENWRRFLAAPLPAPSDEQPKLPAVDPLLRRRMSRVSRMAVSAGFEACRAAGVPVDRPRVLLASRHGELATLVELLDAVSAQEGLSPTAFTASVHHTAGGFFGIAARNKAPARAVAAGEGTFPCAFLDAMGLLSDDPAVPVLLIAADDVVSPPFDRLLGGSSFPCGTAFVLEAGGAMTFSSVSADEGRGGSGGPPALDFLRWFLSETGGFSLNASGRTWSWTR